MRLLPLCLVFLASPALAQMVCSDRDKVLKHLDKGYSEHPVARGLDASGSVLEVLSEKDGKTWTIILTMPSGKSCVVASVEVWETLKPKGTEL